MEKVNLNQNFKDFKGNNYKVRNQYNQVIVNEKHPDGFSISVKDKTLELLGEAQEEKSDGKKKLAQYMLGVKIASTKTLVELSADEISIILELFEKYEKPLFFGQIKEILKQMESKE